MATAGTTIRIELIHSGIGFDQTQKDTLRGLGLRKRHKIVELKDTPQIRGMVYKVRHLVRVLGPETEGRGWGSGGKAPGNQGKAAAKPSPWKGVIIVPGPKTEPKAAKKAAKAKAAKGGPRMKSQKPAKKGK